MSEREDDLEKIVDFVSKIKGVPDVSGVRVAIEYTLVEQRTDVGKINVFQPTIRCQATNHSYRILEEHLEHHKPYVPIETHTYPTKVTKIGETVKSRAEQIARYINSQGFVVNLYLQDPPSIRIFYKN